MFDRGNLRSDLGAGTPDAAALLAEVARTIKTSNQY